MKFLAFMLVVITFTFVNTIASVSQAVAPQTTELSVPPLDHVVYPQSRPEWVNRESTDRRMIVESGPCETADDANAKLELMLPVAIRSLAFGVVEMIPRNFDPIDDDQISSYVVGRYTGSVLMGNVEMAESIAEIAIDDDSIAELRRLAESVEVTHRVAAIGVCLVGGLVALLTSGGMLGFVARRRGV